MRKEEKEKLLNHKSEKNIDQYSRILSSKVRMNHKIKADILEIKEKYAQKRKTAIILDT